MRRYSIRFPSVFLACLFALAVPASGQEICDGVHRVNETGLQSVVISSGMTGDPLFVTAPSGNPDRIFIVEQDGIIWTRARGDGPSTRSVFLDLSSVAVRLSNEMGLLGMAFDPDFDGDPVNGNGHFYVNYTETELIANVFTVVARYTVSAARIPECIAW